MDLIFEEAGGLASNGRSRILDEPVEDICQRITFYAGSPDHVLSTYINREFSTNGKLLKFIISFAVA
jgi:fructose-1,6-bisphosphatase